MQDLSYSISLPIRRPLEEVFQAIVDPAILITYFPIASSDALRDGVTVRWSWGHEAVDFYVDRIVPNERIEAHWEAYGVDYDVSTRFEFQTRSDGVTIVTISESGFHDDELGRTASYAQCSGWTDMLLCLRARLEHNIDLRQY